MAARNSVRVSLAILMALFATGYFVSTVAAEAPAADKSAAAFQTGGQALATVAEKKAPCPEGECPEGECAEPSVKLKVGAKSNHELVGIGVALKSVGSNVIVHKIIPGGAADLDGRLKRGDQIVGVGQGTDGEIENIITLKMQDAVSRIRGKRETVVRIEVMTADNSDQTVVYAITRAPIELTSGESQNDGIEEMSNEVKGVATPTLRRITPIKTKNEKLSTTNAEAKANEPADEKKALATPTHHQMAIIKANVKDLPATKLKCFALTPDGQVLAGCNGETGEIRVFDDEGNYVETWSLPIQPEAMYVRGDGMVFIAGAGELIKLDESGNLVKQSPAPHAESLKVNSDDIRQEVIDRAKQTAERMSRQGEMYDRVIESTEKQIEQLRKRAEEQEEAQQAVSEQRITALERRIEQYKQVKKQWETMQANRQPAELTEEQIEQQVQASIQYKLAASSISATDSNVFVATRAAVGYGFEVWKMDDDFAEAKSIISGLSGCCGQMDVKVNDKGVFVAENSKHRVCRYDADGKLATTWGHGDRTGLEGFGSCCNPMNVAFGPDEVVYTAEDNTGRIKRYSPDGKLLGLVGSVDLVPGCKNCSIAVGPDGDQVYMLDITRDHIVRMDRYAPGEAPAPVAISSPSAVGGPTTIQVAEPPNGGRILVRGLSNFLRLRSTKRAIDAEVEETKAEVKAKTEKTRAEAHKKVEEALAKAEEARAEARILAEEAKAKAQALVEEAREKIEEE